MENHPDQLRHHVLELLQNRNYEEAESIILKMIKKSPPECADLVNLATIYGARSDWDKLEKFSLKALAIDSDSAEAKNNLAIALKNKKKYSQATSILKEIISQYPLYLDPYFNLANAYNLNGDFKEAVVILEKSLCIESNRAATYNDIALNLFEVGDYTAASKYLKTAISIDPSWIDLHINYGNSLSKQGLANEALQQYLKALELDESNGICLHNIASTLQSLGALQESLAFYNHALKVNFYSADLYFNLGILLLDLNKHKEASDIIEQAHILEPNNNAILSQYMLTKKRIADWKSFPNTDRFSKQNFSDITNPFDPFFYLSHHDDPEMQWLNAKAYAQKFTANKSELTQPSGQPKGTSLKAKRKKRLKIGYFSSDFYNHPTTHLMKGVLNQHDTSNFDFYLFDTAPNLAENDPYLEMVRESPLEYLYIGDKSLSETLSLVKTLGIDIAIDLKGYTENHNIHLFSERIAPVQINYLGYPGTLGSKILSDYIIADKIVIPASHEQYYEEKIVRLPGCYQCNDNTKIIAEAVDLETKDARLGAASFVFCCFNNTWKITAKEFDVWMHLLRKNEGSVLWLLSDFEIVRKNLEKEAEERGVSCQRIIFAERLSLDKHLARHQWADLFLDTFTYNAHTTASDALWAGLPVLTMLGNSFPSRVGASILTAAGLPELITSSTEEYESKAQWLVDHPDELQVLKDRLIKDRLKCSLFDTEKTTRHLEQIYRECWQETTGIISE